MTNEARPMHEALRVGGCYIRRVWPDITDAALDVCDKALRVARASESPDATDESLCAVQHDPDYVALPYDEKCQINKIVGHTAIRVREDWVVLKRPNGTPCRVSSHGPSGTHTRHCRIEARPLDDRTDRRRGCLNPAEVERIVRYFELGLLNREISAAMGITLAGVRKRRTWWSSTRVC